MAAVAPMEVCKGEDIRPIPLECVLCPKRPSFSDVSHLLTHVSSKSHLHQKFNMEFKAKTEIGARERLRRYEEWYSINGIETLLSDRLAAKNHKTARRGRSSTSSAKSRQSTSTVDSIKMDFDAASGFHTPDHFPATGHWNATPLFFNDTPNTSYMDESAYHTPASNGQQPSYFFQENAAVTNSDMRHQSLMSDIDSISHTVASDLDRALSIDLLDDDGQENRLKGVVWPGMALFDSATADQKRKRNQRKDGGVIEQMKLTSEAVMATETVWGLNGDIYKVRDIYASPSIDGSPPNSPVRKRKYRPRNTPTITGTLESLGVGDGIDGRPKRKRAGRTTAGEATNSLQTRGVGKTGEKGGKKKKAEGLDTICGAEVHGLPMVDATDRATFNVFYEGSGNNQGQHNRPALQQLDPNMSLAESGSLFKNAQSSRFFDSEAESAQLGFRSQAASFGSGLHGMGNSPMTSLNAHSGGMYATFDSQLFAGGNGDEGSTGPFHGAHGRRLGFAFGLDANANPFGFVEQRDASLREPSFSEQAFRNSAALFDV
ncbi:hypothetical protein CMQ_81 [Grosmannia clavigera kw1407]|uniref:Uncharacterized protein n=1 Tax=Grosmannia clavigera (strain kw1407 / UAMH 11150) TaxID=655863 RepID=F0XRB7_GROCL|nr:uncharacterized protein CMQ_81 [Grosmannia clavigera kw1407]EFW99763.1 hypothetical protein CMQ_81 [Grosmannia clavigera kw1407]